MRTSFRIGLLENPRSGCFNHQTVLTDDNIRRVAPSVFTEGNAQRCSAKYVHVGTGEVVAGLRQAGWAPVAAEEQRCVSEDRRGYQKHVIAFRREDQMQVLDEYCVELLLINSHDAGCAYQMTAGIFRRICSNGLVASDSSFEAIRYRHIGLTVDEVVRGSMTVADAIPSLNDSIAKLRGYQMTDQERANFADRALAMRWPNIGARIGVDYPVSRGAILEPRRTQDVGKDAWTVMNVVQENVIKGGLRISDREKRSERTRSVRGIDAKLDLNRGIWNLATMFADGIFRN